MAGKAPPYPPAKRKIYVCPITYRCYVSTFRSICDTFVEQISPEVGYAIPFTAGEIALLTGLPNKEHTSIHAPIYTDKRPCFLRWDDDIIDTIETIFDFLQGVTQAEINLNYKGRDKLSKLYIDHITKFAVTSCNILLQPIIDSSHWTLLVGLLNEHRTNSCSYIRSLYYDTKGAFDSDIRKWKINVIAGVPIQTNSVDCGMFVCKYMKMINLEGNTTWTNSKSWPGKMPKYRVEFAHELFCKSLEE
ncbi:hypothetical protein IEQ34_000254 [Dendrobium chrysotoxum]|uniref:Ubiquitin-like protease family profile domain-containing protein n=1 Tax=Dendrobium chrysotoxum TaxID=161865 RepID=A0AAV7HNL3_DENCH|nr:hypothetical protein IEQ34_000254 [Dendrobium chrysotoxum]